MSTKWIAIAALAGSIGVSAQMLTRKIDLPTTRLSR